MKRTFTIALVLGLSLATMSTVSAYEHHDYSRWEKRQCRMGPFRSDSRVRDLIRCVHRRVGQVADIPESLYIANRESGYEPKAKNPSSTAGGLYQWLASSWPGHRYPALNRRFHLSTHRPEYDGSGDRFDARTAAFVSALVMRRYGCGAWSMSC